MIKYIDPKEFREKGYLQEVNRLFFHPLGLALEIKQEEDGSETISGVWDYREDPEGIVYGLKDSSKERITKFSDNALFISAEVAKRISNRKGNDFNFGVELIPTDHI